MRWPLRTRCRLPCVCPPGGVAALRASSSARWAGYFHLLAQMKVTKAKGLECKTMQFVLRAWARLSTAKAAGRRTCSRLKEALPWLACCLAFSERRGGWRQRRCQDRKADREPGQGGFQARPDFDDRWPSRWRDGPKREERAEWFCIPRPSSLVTFFWATRRKLPARRAEPADRPSPRAKNNECRQASHRSAAAQLQRTQSAPRHPAAPHRQVSFPSWCVSP